MKKFSFLFIGVSALVLMNSCVENSQKYKDLQAKADSLQTASGVQQVEVEGLLADLNDISAGMQSIREAEHLLALESSGDKLATSRSKQQVTALKNDIRAISEAIGNYKQQIAALDKKNKRQSAEFKKLIAGLNEELELRSTKIQEINRLLAERDKQLAVKQQEIVALTDNVETLNQETTEQKEKIGQQDQLLHAANYLVGTRKELKEAHVISRQGLFCPPIVSSQAQQAAFKTVDVRETKAIALGDKKAKVLSVHPSDSYTLEPDDSGMLVLKIKDENTFWKQTKYLVVMIG